MKTRSRHSTNHKASERARDIDLNYYMRTNASSKKAKHPAVGATKVNKSTDDWLYPLRFTRHPRPTAALALGTTVCGVAVVLLYFFRCEEGNKEKAKEQTREENTRNNWGLTRWWSPRPAGADISTLSQLLASLPFPLTVCLPGSNKDYSCQETVLGETKNQTSEVDEFRTGYFGLTLNKALSKIFFYPFNKTGILIIPKSVSTPATSEDTDSVRNIHIGSSLEDHCDENSPVINPKIPSQLYSLVIAPEMCA